KPCCHHVQRHRLESSTYAEKTITEIAEKKNLELELKRCREVLIEHEKSVKVAKDEVEDVQQRRLDTLIERDTEKNKRLQAEANLENEKIRSMQLMLENKRLEEANEKLRSDNNVKHME
ncbi:hypothetical protein Dimus_026879, partial [Dionaea muscipula]